MGSPDVILERLRESRFSGLRGSSAALHLVLDQGLANQMIAEELLPRQSALRQLEVTFRAGNVVDVRAKPAIPFAVTARVVIDPVVSLSPEPVLTFRFRKDGTSAMLSALLPQLAARLPAGVEMDAEGGRVPLRPLLARWQLDWALPYLAGADVSTLDAQMIVNVNVQI